MADGIVKSNDTKPLYVCKGGEWEKKNAYERQNGEWAQISVAKTTATVTITSKCNGINGDTSSITITSTEPFATDPSNPSNTVTTWTVVCYEMPNCTVVLPIGSTIECNVTDTKQSNRCYVDVNGTKVLEGRGTYLYTVTRDATVDVADKYSMGEYGVITITE
jgi:hypothetical protein